MARIVGTRIINTGKDNRQTPHHRHQNQTDSPMNPVRDQPQPKCDSPGDDGGDGRALARKLAALRAALLNPMP
jgi:hypothetical protein